VPLSHHLVETLSYAASPILGTAAKTDPFHVRTVNVENQLVELDWSNELLEKLRKDHIECVISVVSARGLGILQKLNRQGLKTICVPTSFENDIAATVLSFGFNSALSYATEMLDRLSLAAQAARKIGVVEVLGEHSGWLALQGGIAVCADAVLIPEIPFDLAKVAAKLRRKLKEGRHSGLVVVAEGATSLAAPASQTQAQSPHPLTPSLCPGATEAESSHIIERSGRAAETVALQLQRQTDHETYPLVLSPLVKAGASTAVDCQLGLGYGAAAVRAIKENQTGVPTAGGEVRLLGGSYQPDSYRPHR
jgi:6-phosphofructokinase 1